MNGASGGGAASEAEKTDGIDIKGPEPNAASGAVPVPQVDDKTPAAGQSEQGQPNEDDQAPDPSKKANENTEPPSSEADGSSSNDDPSADSDGG
jgi:hypothetical protein